MRILSAPLIFNPAFEPRPHSLENRAPIAQPKSRTSVRQTERVLLRTTFAQGLCARPLRTTFAHPLYISHIAFVHLRLGHYARSFPVLHQRGGPVQHRRGGPVQHQRGGPVLHQRGAKWRERPPRLRTSCGSDPRMHCASRGPVPPSLRGGRSRHSDPCGKARIAEG